MACFINKPDEVHFLCSSHKLGEAVELAEMVSKKIYVMIWAIRVIHT